MSEAPKFTPGPWDACERGDYADFDGDSNVILGNDTRIAVVQNSGTAEDDANAHLIAAAPEMYAALESAQKLIEAAQPTLERVKVYKKVTASLAKARGESK